MPRWSIFAIDLAIVVISFTGLWLFRDSISTTKAVGFLNKMLMAVISYGFTALIFKTHHGVVRYSTFHDIKHISKTAITATLFYIAALSLHNYFKYHLATFQPSFAFPSLLSLMVISGQVLLRLTVKLFYESLEISGHLEKQKQLFIIGTGHDSINIATQLVNNPESRYKPVAFLSTEGSLVDKRITGIKILNLNDGIGIHKINYNAKSVLIPKSLLKTMPQDFYDNCLKEDIELLTTGAISKYQGTEQPPQIYKIKIEDLLGRDTIKIDSVYVQSHFAGQTVLITGAAGSIGAELTRQIAQFNCKKLVLVDQAETPLNDLWLELSVLGCNTEIKPIVANVCNRDRMRQIFECAKPSVVFHAAAYKHVPMMEMHPSTAVVTNVMGSKICADLSVEYEVKRFVMISTDKAVNPTNVMGASKRAAEIYVQSLYNRELAEKGDAATKFVTTRFGNVLGSNGSVVPLFKKQIENGGPLTLTHREITRYFMTIPEACSLVLEAGCTGKGGEIYIFDMGEPVKIYDLAEKMIRLSGKIPGKDIKIVETGLRNGEKLYEELLATHEDTTPTHHPKLMIAKVREYPFQYAKTEVQSIIDVALKYNLTHDVVLKLKILIPEFKSQNSEYEEIDKILIKNI